MTTTPSNLQNPSINNNSTTSSLGSSSNMSSHLSTAASANDSAITTSSLSDDSNQLSLPGVLGDVLEIHDQVCVPEASDVEQEFFNEAFVGEYSATDVSREADSAINVRNELANEPASVPVAEQSFAHGKVEGGISISLPAALCDEKLIQEIQSIPTKMGFKIGEVADLLGIKQYVLRYWETEFDVLKPRKAVNNQRYYTKKDVENAFLIRKLLHRDRFSIEGARSAMKELKSYVKVEVKKEKDWHGYQSKIDSIETRVDHLMMGLTRLRQLLA